MYSRKLNLPAQPAQSLFLWGPRQTGKTTLLKSVYPQAFRVDLLKSDVLMRYLRKPYIFREDVAALEPNRLVVIDEIQKAPNLLDEVHYLIQEEQRVFVLCGSSARKLRRGHANLLGGRALRYELLGLTAAEIGVDFDLDHFLNTGPLPNHYENVNPRKALQGYVDDYLRNEIVDEGLVRNLPMFADFLRMAAIGDTEVVNLTNIARESGVSVKTVGAHYQILEETLMGAFLPAYTARAKRRTRHAPKFYFRDLGVINHLARRGVIERGSELFGKAFENWVFHELSCYRLYSERNFDLSYWRLSTGVEVDFILGEARVAIEVKGKESVSPNDLKGLLQFQKEHPEVRHLIIVSLEKQARRTASGIDILPYQDFIKKLWDGAWSAEK